MFSLFWGFSALLLCFIIIIILFLLFSSSFFFFLLFLLFSSFFPFLSFTFFICCVDVETKEAGYNERKERKERINNNSSNNTQQQHTANNKKNNKTSNSKTCNNHNTKTPTKKKTTTAKQKRDSPKKRTPNCHQIAHGSKTGRNLRTSQNAIILQKKQAFQKIKTQNFAKCIQKAIFIHTTILNWYICKILGTMWPQKIPIFIRATPCLTGSRWTSPCKNSGLRFYKTELLPHGVCNLYFLASLVVTTLFLWNAYFYSVKHTWAPNRLLGGPRTGPFFEKTWSHTQPSGTYRRMPRNVPHFLPWLVMNLLVCPPCTETVFLEEGDVRVCFFSALWCFEDTKKKQTPVRACGSNLGAAWALGLSPN